MQIRTLSVLALSSRFDGSGMSSADAIQIFFQYSLCRVVLMVTAGKAYSGELYFLSVLALSSRFDGPCACL